MQDWPRNQLTYTVSGLCEGGGGRVWVWPLWWSSEEAGAFSGAAEGQHTPCFLVEVVGGCVGLATPPQWQWGVYQNPGGCQPGKQVTW